MESAQSSSESFPDIDWGWDKANYQAEWHEPIFELMARYVVQGSSVLEVGAGGSHTLGAIAGRLECNAVGVEPDLNGIEKTRELARNENTSVQMIRGDGFCLPFSDGAFDVVYSLGLIEHFEPEESTALVAEHVRVCKDGGQVIVAVPNYLNLPHTIRKFMIGKDYEFYPERSFTPRQLKRILISAGLEFKEKDGVLPLWGVSMMDGGWRVTAILDRFGLASRLNDLKRSSWRANTGYMTYAQGIKKTGT